VWIRKKKYEELKEEVKSLNAILRGLQLEVFGNKGYSGVWQKLAALEEYLNVEYIYVEGKLTVVKKQGDHYGY